MKYYWKVALLLLCIAAVSLGITALTGVSRLSTDGVQVVASFYPVYVAAKQVAGDVDGVQVVNLVDDQVGCLHDYQLSPDDRVVLDGADILVMNGAGAEPFLDAAKDSVSTLADLSAGVPLLESGHVHEGEHEEEHEADNANPHLWVSPPRYRQQVLTLADALCKADPANAERYRENANAYVARIDALWTRMQAAAKALDGKATVVFHDSLAYLAEDLQLNVIASLGVGEDSGVSAHALAAAEEAIRKQSSVLFLYDSQYDTVQYTYLQSFCDDVAVLSADVGVAGEDDADAWLFAMTAICEDLEAAA